MPRPDSQDTSYDPPIGPLKFTPKGELLQPILYGSFGALALVLHLTEHNTSEKVTAEADVSRTNNFFTNADGTVDYSKGVALGLVPKQVDNLLTYAFPESKDFKDKGALAIFYANAASLTHKVVTTILENTNEMFLSKEDVADIAAGIISDAILTPDMFRSNELTVKVLQVQNGVYAGAKKDFLRRVSQEKAIIALWHEFGSNSAA